MEEGRAEGKGGAWLVMRCTQRSACLAPPVQSLPEPVLADRCSGARIGRTTCRLVGSDGSARSTDTQKGLILPKTRPSPAPVAPRFVTGRPRTHRAAST